MIFKFETGGVNVEVITTNESTNIPAVLKEIAGALTGAGVKSVKPRNKATKAEALNYFKYKVGTTKASALALELGVKQETIYNRKRISEGRLLALYAKAQQVYPHDFVDHV